MSPANGVRLQYLDWGGAGPALIFIHGGMDNPHAFDDLAPAFTDRFRVIAYARRAHAQSGGEGPFDAVTLTEDLRRLMDSLRIEKANLAGWSTGPGRGDRYGNQPSRARYTDCLILDGAFDCADPDFLAASKAIPPQFIETPASAMASL